MDTYRIIMLVAILVGLAGTGLLYGITGVRELLSGQGFGAKNLGNLVAAGLLAAVSLTLVVVAGGPRETLPMWAGAVASSLMMFLTGLHLESILELRSRQDLDITGAFLSITGYATAAIAGVLSNILPHIR